jgi:hypothetical protein
VHPGTLHGDKRTIVEAEEMRVACYPTVQAGVLRKRFEEFGGIPRFLFKQAIGGDKDLALKNIRTSQQTALEDVVQSPRRIDNGEIASAFTSLWTLYHLQPIVQADGTTDYFEYTIVPCCDDAGTRIRDQLMKKSVSDLWTIFFDTKEELGALREIRFEAYAHKKILSEGLQSQATRLTQTGLSPAAPMQVNIPPLSKQIDLPDNNVGQTLEDAVTEGRATHPGSYLLPHLSNFPVVDAIFIPPTGEAVQLQMKVGRSRPLATDKATAITTATGSNKLVFVVPDVVSMTEELPGANLQQYRIVLNEST